MIPTPIQSALATLRDFEVPTLLKKTQRDKDWATIGELVDADTVAHSGRPDANRVGFWLRESRDADALIELTSAFRDIALALSITRPLLVNALARDRRSLELGLAQEQIRGKQADRDYWAPLRAELEQIRHDQRRSGAS